MISSDTHTHTVDTVNTCTLDGYTCTNGKYRFSIDLCMALMISSHALDEYTDGKYTCTMFFKYIFLAYHPSLGPS